MARRIIQPDLEGRLAHEPLSAQAERLALAQRLTKWLTIPGCLFAAVMLMTHVASVLRGWGDGWGWMLITSIGLSAAFAASAIRLRWQEWSWTAFLAALGVHGYGMYRSYEAFADQTGVMDVIPETETLLLAALLSLHAWLSTLERRAGQEGRP